MDPKQLYQEVILDHNKKPRNYGKLEDATHRSEGLNPLCGDHIWVSLKVAGDTIEKIAFEGQSCAICKASASMMTGAVKGKRVADAESMVAHFRAMATGTADDEATKALADVQAKLDEETDDTQRTALEKRNKKDLSSQYEPSTVSPWRNLSRRISSRATTRTSTIFLWLMPVSRSAVS